MSKRVVSRRQFGDLDSAYEQAAYDELVRRGDVTHLDVPVQDHPDFIKMILPTANEMMSRDSEDAMKTASDDDVETREERLDRLGGNADDYMSRG